MLGRRGLLLVHAHPREEEHRRTERGRVEDRHRTAAEDCVQPGARKRRDDPQPLARGRHRAVGGSEQFLREHDLEQRRASGVEDRADCAVCERDRVEQPRIAAIVDE
jgi:hypothetical protein